MLYHTILKAFQRENEIIVIQINFKHFKMDIIKKNDLKLMAPSICFNFHL